MRRRASFLPPVLLENLTNVFKPSTKSGKVWMQFTPVYDDVNNVKRVQAEYFRDVFESDSNGVRSAINFIADATRWLDYEDDGYIALTWGEMESGQPDEAQWQDLVS